jgi:hypothetical protein
MSARCFRIHPEDNVATLLDDAPAGPVALIDPSGTAATLVALEPIARGHKIAVRDIAVGEAVIKFGARIGHCTLPIARGAWVHLHNLASDLDERSARLDLHSGVANDNAAAYE